MWYVLTYMWIFICKEKKAILQSTDSRKWNNKECRKACVWISLRKGNKTDIFLGDLSGRVGKYRGRKCCSRKISGAEAPLQWAKGLGNGNSLESMRLTLAKTPWNRKSKAQTGYLQYNLARLPMDLGTKPDTKLQTTICSAYRYAGLKTEKKPRNWPTNDWSSLRPIP